MVSYTPYRAKEFKSAYGPLYSYQPNFRGQTGKQIFRVALKAGFFGGALGVAALFFASGIPRIQKDILQKVPILNRWYHKEVHPADNPF